jgi:hypothetical protein
MKGRHVQKGNKLQTLNKVLDWAIIGMVVVCTLIAIPTVRNLMDLEKGVEELKVSILNLERQQDELQIALTHRAAEMAEAQASAVQQPTGQAYTVTVAELQTLAKIVYQEARGIPQKSHQAAVIWCILNRLDNGYWGDDIITVATYPNAFAWVPDTPVEEEFMDLAIDVVTRWNWEKQGLQDVGRTLPATYLYFTGNGDFNYFTREWKGTEYWDWSLPDPYLS